MQPSSHLQSMAEELRRALGMKSKQEKEAALAKSVDGEGGGDKEEGEGSKGEAAEAGT